MAMRRVKESVSLVESGKWGSLGWGPLVLAAVGNSCSFSFDDATRVIDLTSRALSSFLLCGSQIGGKTIGFLGMGTSATPALADLRLGLKPP